MRSDLLPYLIMLLATVVVAASSSASGQTAPGCNLTGSESVFAEGSGMLRLSDVVACPGLRYEVIPNVIINGEPAVRLLPSEECAAGGAASVTINGAPAARQGDVACTNPQ